MRPNRFAVGPLATADDNGVALSQAVAAAGFLTLTGAALVNADGVAVMDVPRRIIVTSSGNDTGITFTIVGNNGLNGSGNPITETITGASGGAASTSLDFGTVESVYASGAAAGTVIVGTNGVASSPWQMVNTNEDPVNLTVAVVVSGTVNYDLEYTYDDVLGQYDGQGNWQPPGLPTVWDDATMVNETGNEETTFSLPIAFWRITLNSGTGSLAVTAIQAGIRG